MSAWMAENENDAFDDEIESVQHRLHAYVFTLIGRNTDVADVVQETNRVLWRKRDDFEPGTNFWAWASKVAFFQVMAHRKRQSRDRHLFGDEILHLMADEMSVRSELPGTPPFEEIAHCLTRLPDRQQEAVKARYFEEESVAEISSKMAINENAVNQLLFRARKSLRDCLAKTNRDL